MDKTAYFALINKVFLLQGNDKINSSKINISSHFY